MENTASELSASNTISFSLPEDPTMAAMVLQQYLSFSCSGVVEVTRVMEGIDGWFTVQAGAALYTAALLAPAKADFVEIGSFKGRSTAVLGFALKATQKGGKIFAIDPHIGSEEHQAGGAFADRMPSEGTTYNEFLRNMRQCGLENEVVPMRMPSLEAVKQWKGGPVGLLFIDGDHSIAGCEGDFLAWERFVMPGGIVLLHDVGPDFPGPQHVVDRYFKGSSRYKSLFQVDSLHVAIKR